MQYSVYLMTINVMCNINNIMTLLMQYSINISISNAMIFNAI